MPARKLVQRLYFIQSSDNAVTVAVQCLRNSVVNGLVLKVIMRWFRNNTFMLERQRISTLNDYFAELNQRPNKGVYFYRIIGYSDEIDAFIKKYYDAARRGGVVIEGKIPNPDDKNLAYYNEIMGMNFNMDLEFITVSLKKWLPRMNDFQRKTVADSIYSYLTSLRRSGKNDNMLKNAYIKFMCWLYYKFERIVGQLGENNIPKILYEGNISNYELMLISVLSSAGCDVVLLQYQGDHQYLKLDPNSSQSDCLQLPGLRAFPEGYSLKSLREAQQREYATARLYGTPPTVSNCTNAWISGKIFDDIRTSAGLRGKDERFFYNCFCRVNGAEDKNIYSAELFQLQQELKNSKRRLVIVSGEIPKPLPEEIDSIPRKNYAKLDQLVLDLVSNTIKFTINPELQRLIHKAFVDVVLAEAKKCDSNLNRLTGKAVYWLCWLKRYVPQLLGNWKISDIGCFIYLGGCRNEQEAAFLRILAKLPVDVLILCPNLNEHCCLEDKLLYEVNNPESVNLTRYPEDNGQVQMATVAYHAERELDTLLYQNTGMYRTRQYALANAISLKTTYEEIKILWDKEVQFRLNFGTVDQTVNVPVIFAKVCGVKNGDVSQYWQSIRELIIEDTFLIQNVPFLSPTGNPMKPYVSDFYKNGRLQKRFIKSHPHFPYGILRDEMQDYVLDKLETMIEQKLIKGIGENGTEYTVVATVLNLPGEILRSIQKFDFTKRNPKLIYVNATETVISLEDSILVAFLNLIGFDILFFVPTGYKSVEKFFNNVVMEELQIGEYLYDLDVPDLKTLPLRSIKLSWRERLFGRGK